MSTLRSMSGPVPDLSVIIVNYNTGDYLRKCIGSALDRAGDATVEVVVIDNASHDDSAQRAAVEHPPLRLIQNADNRGFAAAVNQGIRATSSPFLFLLNPDAEISSGTLAGLLKLARDRPAVGAIGVLVRDPDGNIYPSARKVPTISEAIGHAFLHPFRPDNRFSRAYTMAEWDRSSEREVEWVSGSSMLLRRAALDEVGLLDERYFLYAEDVDICTRLRRGGWRVLFSPELQIIHVGGVSTGRSPWAIRQHSKSIYRYYAKHEAGGWRRVLLPLAWAALRARATIVIRREGQS
jgi:N-acetylglucosaminyl-diphospho-decaprenol L-rhamnosyltransferase